MKAYNDLVKKILEEGVFVPDRTGVGTIKLFGVQSRYPLSPFPLMTTKKIHWPSVVHELLWFLKGETNIEYLKQNNVRIWNEWADEDGNLGPVYGAQWRNFNGQGIDQVSMLIEGLKKDPYSRRHIISAWNPAQISEMALPPCHILVQFNVMPDKTGKTKGVLHCQLYQRSCDIFLGCPFNIASYSLLTHMVAHVCGFKVGDFIHSIGDAHIYGNPSLKDDKSGQNHIPLLKMQLEREILPLPKIILNPEIKNILDFKYEDIELVGYDPHPAIKGRVAV